MRSAGARAAMALLVVAGAGPAAAEYRDDIGYSALVADLGATLPDGAAIPVDQVEASVSGDPELRIYLPDPGNAGFAGVTFVDRTQAGDPGYSTHATGVALRFAGNDAITPGVAQVDNYETLDWLARVLFGDFFGDMRPQPGTGVLANHAWVGQAEPAAAAAMATRLDWLIANDGYVQVVAARGSDDTLLAQAFNVIAVAATALPANGTSQALDAFYTAGRVLPHMVAPLGSSSAATAVVSAAAALLLDAAPGDTLAPETLKAVLMASAQRLTRNSQGADVADYAANSANGLDSRYGAGQLDVAAAYALLAAGERPSLADGGAAHPAWGYDHDAAFGGIGVANATAHYVLAPPDRGGRLAVTLAWPAAIVDDSGPFEPQRTLYDLNLVLYDTGGEEPVAIAGSASARDNTETLLAEVTAGHGYVIEVVNAHGSPIDWRYALAWYLDSDGDADGLPDRFEIGACPHADDADSDDDGLGDGVEDADGDGVLDAGETDPCVADSDADGLLDGTEAGVVAAIPDADGDGPLRGTDLALFVADADPTTTTDPRDADSDDDGYADGAEDRNRDGRVDAGEADPNDASSQPPPVTAIPLPAWLPWLAALGLARVARRIGRNRAGPLRSQDRSGRVTVSARRPARGRGGEAAMQVERRHGRAGGGRRPAAR